MTEFNKEELRRLAEATGGITWVASHATSHQGQRASRSIYHYPTPYHCVEIIETPDSDPENNESIHEHSAWEFIGAANPAAVLSLLDEADAREEKARATSLLWLDENAKLRAEVESLRAQLKACHPFRPAHEPVTVFAPGCLVCGQYTDHGGLQCPKMRAACTAQEGSAND